MRKHLLAILPLVVVSLAVHAADKDSFRPRRFDWPQWQGPERTTRSRETGLLKKWPADGPKLLWKAGDLGENYCTPTVAARRIFLMGNRDGKEYVIALAEETGKERWAAEVGTVRANGGGYAGPRSSPTVDGARVYALGLAGDLLCLEAASGKVRWQKDLVKDFKGSLGGWGCSESPLIDGDRVLCTPGGRTATLVALDKKSGETIWKGVVPEGDSAQYSSIVVTKIDGKKQYVQFLSGGVVGLSEDGEFLWRYDRPANGTANCSTPVCADGHIFAASGYGAGGGLARIVRKENGYEAREVYSTKKMKNHHGGMVLVDGYLYGSDEGLLTCLDYKTGEVQWAERAPGKGSIAYADGRLYYRNESGPVFLVEANPKKYVECGRFTPPGSGSPEWPHPIIANGRLYIQDQDTLRCYDVKQ